VAVTESLTARNAVRAVDGSFVLGAAGAEVFGEIRVDADGLRRQRRPLLRPCLDWTERRHHLAGGMGAALASELVRREWICRRAGSRIVALTPAGAAGLGDWLGVDLARLPLAVSCPPTRKSSSCPAASGVLGTRNQRVRMPGSA